MQKQQPKNHCLQEANTHWQTTWPNVLQSYFTQSDHGMNHKLFATYLPTTISKFLSKAGLLT